MRRSITGPCSLLMCALPKGEFTQRLAVQGLLVRRHAEVLLGAVSCANQAVAFDKISRSSLSWLEVLPRLVS